MPATGAASRRTSTPRRLRRLLALILGATAVLWITATILVQGQRGTVASVRGGSSPAWLDAVEAHAALSDADLAAWQSFRSLLGMFRDAPAARKLIAYLTTPEAQEAWIKRPGSGAISVNRLVPLGDYPDPVSRELARDLITARSVRFDASDSMPQVMESAFNNAVLEYLDSPVQLEVILRGLDQVRKVAYLCSNAYRRRCDSGAPAARAAAQ